jgi:hypothetical protein
MIAGAMALPVDIGERLRGEMTGVLLAQRLRPFAQLSGEPGSSSASQPRR